MPDFWKAVRQIANERWDLPDAAAAIASLLADTISRAEAGDLGVSEGVLSRSEVSFETSAGPTYTLRLGGCLLYGCKPDATPSNLSTAAPVVYDPADPNQIMSSVDISSFASGTTHGAIWWMVSQAQTDLENRRVWAAGFPDGQITAMNTRLSPRVTFQTSADLFTPPSDPGTWYRFAAFDFPAAPAAPTVVLCHALDYGFENSALAVAQGTVSPNFWLGQVALANRSATTNSGRSYSVARLLTQFAMAYLKTLDSTNDYDPETLELTSVGSDNFVTVPPSGIAQIYSAATGATADITDLQARNRLVYWGRVQGDAVTPTFLAQGGDAFAYGGITCTLNRGGAGIVTLLFSGALAASTAVISFQCQANDFGQIDIITRYTISSTSSITVYTYHIGDAFQDRDFSFQVFAINTAY